MSRSRLAADKPPAPAPDPRAPLRWRRYYMDGSALVSWAYPYYVERWGLKRFRLVREARGERRHVVGEHKTLSAAKAAAAAHQEQQEMLGS